MINEQEINGQIEINRLVRERDQLMNSIAEQLDKRNSLPEFQTVSKVTNIPHGEGTVFAIVFTDGKWFARACYDGGHDYYDIRHLSYDDYLQMGLVPEGDIHQVEHLNDQIHEFSKPNELGQLRDLIKKVGYEKAKSVFESL